MAGGEILNGRHQHDTGASRTWTNFVMDTVRQEHARQHVYVEDETAPPGPSPVSQRATEIECQPTTEAGIASGCQIAPAA